MESILNEGAIRLERNLSEGIECTALTQLPAHIQAKAIAEDKDAIHVAWFSTNQFWENTVLGLRPEHPAFFANPSQMQGLFEAHGIYRIGVATTSLERWTSITHISPPDRRRRMLWSARQRGANPKEWYVSLIPVVRDRWLAIEEFDGSKWIELGE